MKTVTNINDRKQFFASDELIEEIKGKIKPGDTIINFAYTDYGGGFYDKVCIKYFSEQHPGNLVKETTSYNGENAFFFGEPAKQFFIDSEDYPLPGNLEDYYTQMESEQETEDFSEFLKYLSDLEGYDLDFDKTLYWLCENKGGYYNITTQGVDFNENDLIEDLIKAGLINKK